jgi:integrase
MCLATNIVRRGARYYVRLRVPVDLVPILGKAEIWKSLQTSEPKQAKRKAPLALAKIHRSFETARLPGGVTAAAESSEFTEDQLRSLTHEFYAGELAADDRERQNGISRTFGSLIREPAANLAKKDLAIGNFLPVYYAADAIFASQGFLVRPPADEDLGPRLPPYLPHRPGDPDTYDDDELPEEYRSRRPIMRRDDARYRELCYWLLRAKVEADNRFLERDRGDFTGKPGDPILTQPAPSSPITVSQTGESERLEELHERYLAERQGITEDWKNTNRASLRLFSQHLGSQIPPNQITKRHVRAFKDALLKFPTRGTLRDRDATFQEIIAQNQKVKLPTISARTINKHLSAVSAFADWLVENELMESNPVTGVYLSDETGQDKRDPFTIRQLEALFASPVYKGTQSREPRLLHRPGKIKVRDHHYWVPLLGCWSGARLAEILQLGTDDIQEIASVTCLNINSVGGKRIKTRSSKRIVPVHSHLIKLGFLDYVSQRRKSGGGALFPGVGPDKWGRISSEFSKWFSSYLRKIGVKKDARISFHSFRHGFADQMRIAGYGDADIGVILGHAAHSVTAGYGAIAQFGAKERGVMVESVKYEGLTAPGQPN